MPLYLGLDSSTQSLTALVLEVAGSDRSVVFEHALSFDRDLSEYGTRHGILPTDDPAVAVSPPLMWADALHRMIEALANSDLDLSGLAAIAGSAQQHGSVCLGAPASGRLAGLDPARSLVDQLGPEGFFSRSVSPIWMDSSTSEECEEITRAIGGADRLARLTGSRAFERFTGPQIRKFAKREPMAWKATQRIHLVSSFMASLLLGDHAPVDPGDASGMNLMDLSAGAWSAEAVGATAPGLAAKLPSVVPASTVIGKLAPYWQHRFGLPPAGVVVWSGDNPSSLVGTGLVREGQIALSLGTSDTLFGPMDEPRVDASGTGHVFGAPTGGFMGLTCFRNGSLARERIRDEHGLDWEGFSAALRSTPPGNDGALMLPWFEPEITPDVRMAGVERVDLDSSEPARNVRAVVEAQMMAMANHSRWIGVEIDTIHATGGGARNTDILQIVADVFGAEVQRFEIANSASLGAALRAWHADALAGGGEIPWPEIVAGIAAPVAGSSILPDPAARVVYDRLRPRYADLESAALQRM